MQKIFTMFLMLICSCVFVGNIYAENILEPQQEPVKMFLSEKFPESRISEVISSHYQFTDEESNATHYNYNYVDLNDDGQQEIFVVVSGPYTSGSGGSSALLLEEKQHKLQVRSAFTLVNTPVIITEDKKHDYKSLVFPYYGGGQPYSLSLIEYNGKNYPNVNDGIIVDKNKQFSGRMILADKTDENSFSGWKVLTDNNFYGIERKAFGTDVIFPVLTDHPGELTREYANQSLKNTALHLYRENAGATVDYAVTCNTKKLLSTLYAAKKADGTIKLAALNMEMGRAKELTLSDIFKNPARLAALTGWNNTVDMLFCFTDDGIIFIKPACDSNIYGYEAVNLSLQEIKPYLKKGWKKKLF